MCTCVCVCVCVCVWTLICFQWNFCADMYSMLLVCCHLFSAALCLVLCTARHSYSAEWSRVKGFVILLIASVAMSLIAEVLTDNIEPVLKDFGVSEV